MYVCVNVCMCNFTSGVKGKCSMQFPFCLEFIQSEYASYGVEIGH